jgi:hypothetical protein
MQEFLDKSIRAFVDYLPRFEMAFKNYIDVLK